MTNKLILASAGAGKTEHLVRESIEKMAQGQKVLVVTYTRNNQKEILDRFHRLSGFNSKQFVVKGLYTFLLEDIVRPYQRCIFGDRIKNIVFNSHGDPHKKNGRTLRGTGEKTEQGEYNPRHFLSTCRTKAHTTYIAQLACRVINESGQKPIARLEKIYSHIYFDEVQDLIGWDYEVLKHLARSIDLDITCVGDFRQTIYETAITQKQPKTISQKLARFNQLNFEIESMSVNRRSIQCICDFADAIHADANYEPTISLAGSVPEHYREHVGIFIVKRSDVPVYIEKFTPVLLRHSVRSGSEYNEIAKEKMNFGQSKGQGFPRVLILPTPRYKSYLAGDQSIFSNMRTDDAKNKLYVAVTRAKYSIGFIVEDNEVAQFDIPQWLDT